MPKLDGYTFEGYRNADGTVGTKNILAISTTVQCVAATVDYAVRRIKAEMLPRYPNVDDVVAIAHHYGCGVAIDAPGASVPIRTLRNLSLNPNFGGEMLLVSLGCEKLQPSRMVSASALNVLEDDSSVAVLQDSEQGFGEMVGNIMAQAEKKLKTPQRAPPRLAVPPPNLSSACSAAAPTPSPASLRIPRWAGPRTCWCEPAQP